MFNDSNKKVVIKPNNKIDKEVFSYIVINFYKHKVNSYRLINTILNFILLIVISMIIYSCAILKGFGFPIIALAILIIIICIIQIIITIKANIFIGNIDDYGNVESIDFNMKSKDLDYFLDLMRLSMIRNECESEQNNKNNKEESK